MMLLATMKTSEYNTVPGNLGDWRVVEMALVIATPGEHTISVGRIRQPKAEAALALC